MSQRSQVAKSGSRPIEQCSAACAEPGQVDGEQPGSSSSVARGRSTRRRWCAGSAPAGRAAPRRSPRRWAGDAAGTRPPGGRRRPCPARAGTRPRCGGRARRRSGCRWSRGRSWSTPARRGRSPRRARRGRATRPARSRPGARRPRRRGRSSARSTASTVPITRPVAASTSETGRPPPERMSARSLARLGSVQNQPLRPAPQQPAPRSARPADLAGCRGRTARSSASVSGTSCAAAHRCGPRT